MSELPAVGMRADHPDVDLATSKIIEDYRRYDNTLSDAPPDKPVWLEGEVCILAEEKPF